MEHAIELETETPRFAGLAATSERGDVTVVGDRGVARWLDGQTFATGVAALAVVTGEIWVVTEGCDGHQLERRDTAGRLLAQLPLGDLGADIQIAVTRTGLRSALIEGDRGVLVRERDGGFDVESLGERRRDRRFLVGGRGVAERRGARFLFRGGVLVLPPDLAAASTASGALVLDGSAVLVELEHAGGRIAVMFDVRRGQVKMRIRLGEARVLAVAERRGLVVLGRDSHVALFDLRAGRCVGERILPAPVTACAIDANGTRIVVVDGGGSAHELAPSLANWTACTEESAEAEDAPDDDPVVARTTTIEEAVDEPAPMPVQPPAPAPVVAHVADELDAVADLALAALGPASTPALARDVLDAYLGDARAWVVALCRSALANGFDRGRLGRSDGTRVLSAELDAVLGMERGRAHDEVTQAHDQERDAARRFAHWNRDGAPHVELARELGLSPLALSLLMLAAAPQIWGELARAYGLCTADPARPLVDELLLSHLLDADTATRAAIGRELDDDAPLVARGAVVVGRGLRPYAAITVHPAIARRLAGVAPAGDVAVSLPGACALGEILGPRAEIAAVARALSQRAATPPRIVLRGRSGVGRRTVAAALAARVERGIGLVAIETAASDADARLRQRLHDVALRGDLPCVDLDALHDDPVLRARVRVVLDEHRGPLFMRAPRSGELPLAPGYLAVDFVPLAESERGAAWLTVLAKAGLDEAAASALATRFAVGPGAMTRACAAVDRNLTGAELETALIASLRQHRSARIEAVASRVEHLASWADLIVPEDIADVLHELCARVHHRRTVLEDWGLRGVASTARGVTALFQGGPGTGKTMAAEVIAHTLGYELWRVDLSKIVSKWIGETEKNLAAVFDAAEDGEIVLLFDEADSLFGKRTEVKSSHDRNANLETNYLLQRLDTFTGVAILTTNFGTAIDPAFQRRLSVQAQFPFPDEHDRERLWRAHMPSSLPVAEDLDLASLSRKFPLTGGYIRNAVLRAAYLAAGRGTPLSTADLERAVRSEYLARGKVSANGALL